MGVLPFVPYNIVSRVTSRGLNWKEISVEEIKELGTQMHPKQAFSFMFVYLLCGLAVKYYVNLAFGTKPPQGADRGITTIMDSPMGQKVIRSFGIDPNDLKVD